MYISKDFENVTLKQFELMAHTIGFERKKISYNKFEACRNYFSTHEKATNFKDLEKLVDLGLMISRQDGSRGWLFHVTRRGFDLFGSIYDCRIREVD